MSSIKNFPLFVMASQRTFMCVGEFNSKEYNESEKYIDGKGYLDSYDNRVWIFVKEKPRFDSNVYPYFWRNKEKKEFEKSNPSKEVLNTFQINNLIERKVDDIISSVIENPDEGSGYNDDLINNLNSSSEIFRPVVHAKDDFLKKMVKEVINTLGVVLSKYKHKVKKQYLVSNMKSSLTSNTKTSPTYYNMWAEMLGINTIVIAYSRDDAEDKLSEPLMYVSERDSVYKISDADEFDLQGLLDKYKK